MTDPLKSTRLPSAAATFALRRWVRVRWVLIVMALTMVSANQLWAESDQSAPAISSEYKLKVAYLYNFTRYVAWPEDAFAEPQSPFVIGVVGPDPFGTMLDQLASRKQAQGRPIVVRRLESLQEAQDCHIVFISQPSSESLHDQAIELTRDRPVLLVGESDGFAEDGSSISFYLDKNGTIGLAINVDAVRRQGLRVDAKLLKIALVVSNKASRAP